MKYLITLLIATLSLNAFGQGIPQLPYNPDENGDGLIGVPDLQALLSQYGLEFNSAVLSEDAQSAIVYMGEMAHPLCTQACENLPGFWHMSTMDDLALVWDEVISSGITWLKKGHNTTNLPDNPYQYFEASNSRHYSTLYPNQDWKCYCATRELPKVEYSYCTGTIFNSNLEYLMPCVEEKVQDGWYPRGGISSAPSNNLIHRTQAFWRWAE
jgi:hypothetical protein